MFRLTLSRLQPLIQKNLKTLLIVYLHLLNQTLKMASNKPKHVANVLLNCLCNKVILDLNNTSINREQCLFP
jgi:hypothetical protein